MNGDTGRIGDAHFKAWNDGDFLALDHLGRNRPCG